MSDEGNMPEESSDHETPSLESSELTPYNEERKNLSGLSLSLEPFVIKSLLQTEKDADIYSVSWTSDNVFPGCEVRAYLVEEIPEKLQNYRFESIKRLEGRTLWEERKDGFVILLVVADTEDLKLSSFDESKIPKDEKIKQNEEAGVEEGDSKNTTEDTTNEEETLYLLLHLAYTNRPELLDQLPPASREALEGYLQNLPLKFNDCDEMEAFAAIKLHEVLFLRREEKKLPDRIQKRKDEYLNIMREQALLRKGSQEHRMKQVKVSIAQYKLEVIMNVQKYLPLVIKDADGLYSELVNGIKYTRELEEGIRLWKKELEEEVKLRRKVEFLKAILQQVVPGSSPYVQAFLQLQVAEETVRNFVPLVERSEVQTLEVWTEKYENSLIWQ